MTRLPQSRFFDEFFREFPFSLAAQSLHGDPLPSPEKIRIDVKGNGADVIVHAEVSGVDKNDIDVSVDDGIVTIPGGNHRAGASLGTLFRCRCAQFFASLSGCRAKAKAAYENGILLLTLSKQSPGTAKRIAVE